MFALFIQVRKQQLISIYKHITGHILYSCACKRLLGQGSVGVRACVCKVHVRMYVCVYVCEVHVGLHLHVTHTIEAFCLRAIMSGCRVRVCEHVYGYSPASRYAC